ncbi:MAG TPA: sensor domain-containing diguanylate cyclase [Thauera sp.]|nr:sensor domain-containing diguanylate cyclase [Thauera sp.]
MTFSTLSAGMPPTAPGSTCVDSDPSALVQNRNSLWHVLFEQSRDGVVVLDEDGKVFEANRRFADMLGYSPDEMAQLHVWDWDAQFSREELLALLRAIDSEGDHFETRQRRKDGTLISVELSNSSSLYHGRKLIFCICRDITERKAAEARVHHLATTDALTGTANRREFTRALSAELERARRYASALSLIMFDLDHFKCINDTAGHDAGDKVLSEVARAVRGHVRSVDLVGRWGGEEFMVLMPESGLADAQAAAEKLRQLIERCCAGWMDGVSASFGVAEYRAGDDGDRLCKRADLALYKAKAAGRNRVECASEGWREPLPGHPHRLG